LKAKNSQSENHPKASIETSSLQLQQEAMRQKHNQKKTHTKEEAQSKNNTLTLNE